MPTMTDNFPTDWVEWRGQWNDWIASHPQLVRTNKAIPGKNFLADEILGTFRLPSGRVVELSELTFPNLEERDESGRLLDYRRRSIGMTFVDDRSGRVVHNFTELEAELEL